LFANGEAKQICIDGLLLGDALEAALDEQIDASRVRINGIETLGDLNDFDVPDKAVVIVMSAAIASKGVSGA